MGKIHEHGGPKKPTARQALVATRLADDEDRYVYLGIVQGKGILTALSVMPSV